MLIYFWYNWTLGLLHYFLLLIVLLCDDWLWTNDVIHTVTSLDCRYIRALLVLTYWRAVVKYLLGNISTVVVCLITVLATRSYCPVRNNLETWALRRKRSDVVARRTARRRGSLVWGRLDWDVSLVVVVVVVVVLFVAIVQRELYNVL